MLRLRQVHPARGRRVAIGANVPAEGGVDVALENLTGSLPSLATTEGSASRRRTTRRGMLVRRALLVADLVALVSAYAVTLAGSGGTGDATGLWLLIPATMLAAKLGGFYDRDEHQTGRSTVDEVVPILKLVTLVTWLGVVAAWVADAEWSTGDVALFWGLAVPALLTSRAAARSLARRHHAFVQNTVIVGAGDVGQLVGRKLQQHPELGVHLVGFVDTQPRAMRSELTNIPVIGSVAEIDELVASHDVHRVIIAFSNERHDELLRLVRTLRKLHVQIDVVPRLFEAVGPAVDIHTVEGLALVALPPRRISRAGRTVKRSIDLTVAVLGLIVTAPLFLWVSWRIHRASDGPVFFRQTRLGAGMKQFTLLKFRTMATDTDPDAHREYMRAIMDPAVPPTSSNLYKLERQDAVTPIGAWLRRTSLDELPQLINVLRGEMSLVGPRPCIPYETDLFDDHHFDRFIVPAGMTGLWQVAARANATFREALDLDAAYARNWSLGLDLSLLARTPAVVLRGKKTTT